LKTNLGRHRVLVVDDNVDAAHSLGMLLKISGQDVVVAHEGDDALRKALEHHPELILLDIGMPGMDGYEVCRRLRALPQVQMAVLVALTGWGQEEDRQRSWQAGFDHHFVKPIDWATLGKLLANLDERSTQRENP
jgi:two-component system CheB/CheR fusion protein